MLKKSPNVIQVSNTVDKQVCAFHQVPLQYSAVRRCQPPVTKGKQADTAGSPQISSQITQAQTEGTAHK